MDSRVPENIAFIQFQLHPNYSTTSTGIVGCCGVKFGCNRNMIKYIFLESGNIIDYHSRLDFCRPFYSLPTQASNTPWNVGCMLTNSRLHDITAASLAVFWAASATKKIQGCTKRPFPGCVSLGWKNCVLLPAAGKQNATYSSIWKNLLVQPC